MPTWRPRQEVAEAPRQRGIALIMVLWLTVMLTVVGGAFAFSMRSEVLAARNAVSLAQVRAAADGALDRTVFELLRPRTNESWKADGAVPPVEGRRDAARDCPR